MVPEPAFKEPTVAAPVTTNDVAVAWVKTAVEGVEEPMGVVFIVPASMVRLLATLESAKVPSQPMVKVAVPSEEVAKVIETLVSLTVLTDMVALLRPAHEEDR